LKRTELNLVYKDELRQRLNEIYHSSQMGLNFKNLKKTIVCKDNFILALRQLSLNSGRETPGPDGLKFSDVKHKLKYEDFEKWFYDMKPMNSRLVYIPKANGKMRPLGIANIYDRIIQQMFYNVLEPIGEGRFRDCSFGFRREVQAKDAIHKVVRHGMTNPYAVEIDFKDFFNNIPHWKIIQSCYDIGIHDKYVLKAIKIILRSPINGAINECGVPQGGILSPLLANIVLHEIDCWIQDSWENYTPNRGADKKTFQSRANSFEGGLKVSTETTYEIHYSSIRNGKKVEKSMIKNHQRKIRLKSAYYVRYADDSVILCRNYKEAKKWYYAFIEKSKRMGLIVNEEKSKVSDMKKGIDFLGYNIRMDAGIQRWKHRKIYKPMIRMKQKNIEKYISQARKKLDLLYNNQITSKDWNSFVTGIVNYYDYMTEFYETFESIEHETYKGYNKLHNRNGWKLSYIPKQYLDYVIHGIRLKRYKNRKVMWKIENDVLEVLHIWNHRKKKKYVYNQPDFPKNRILWDNPNKHKFAEIFKTEWYKIESRLNRKTLACEMYFPSLLSTQKCKCKCCKENLYMKNTEVHHIHMRKYGGKDKYKNLILVCESCHKEIHSKKENSSLLINKYRNKLEGD